LFLFVASPFGLIAARRRYNRNNSGHTHEGTVARAASNTQRTSPAIPASVTVFTTPATPIAFAIRSGTTAVGNGPGFEYVLVLLVPIGVSDFDRGDIVWFGNAGHVFSEKIIGQLILQFSRIVATSQLRNNGLHPGECSVPTTTSTCYLLLLLH